MSSITAAVMPGPDRPIELRDFPEPEIAPGGMLMRTLYSEVCGTDVHLWHGRLSGVPYPIIPGHVSVGFVDKMRGEVRGGDGHRFREGDRVVFYDVHRTCGRCYACAVTGTPTKCVARKVYGITDSASDGLFGGWSEAIYLEPGVVSAHPADEVSAEDYIGAGCGLITAVHAIDRASIALADTVLVQGTGAVGLSIIALARLSGASTIVAIGAPDNRLELAKRMGADLALDLRGTSIEARRREAGRVTRGRGFDVGIEASGSPRAVEEGLSLMRDGGRYVIAGHYTDAGPSQVNAHDQINRKQLEIRGCWGSQAGHFLRALVLLERFADRIPWHAIGAKTYPLDSLNEALADAEAMRLPKALVAPQRRGSS
ncbi:MAG: zinc-binding dehydrogenase [Acidobacteria bacterium]|nr:zinc-binding dehydrogenase [Acidobacteriota bacterium]